jgi:hypothetical protein
MFAVSRLHKTATSLQEDARYLRARDIVDWADWFVSLGRSLPILQVQILNGSFAPSPPTRYELPKAKGSFRLITTPNMRDALVYRHIADVVLVRALPTKVKGAYFSRRRTPTPIGPTFNLDPTDPYHKFFTVWLTYNSYRSKTLLNQPHDVLVVTDISNYFDSIQHDLLLEYLSPLGLPRKTAGLLGRLLEALRPQAGHSPNPRVGLAQDEFDCSRELAHVFLFEHDRRMVEVVGEDKYVRWMDDQNIGTPSTADARRTVNLLTRSLGQQRLTINAGKTRFLTPPQVVDHFQLVANESLDQWSKTHSPFTPVNVIQARQELRTKWAAILSSNTVGVGNWEKILKRMYAYAIQVDIPDLEDRAFSDLVEYPELADRIFQYFAARNRSRALIDLFKTYRVSGEDLYEATDADYFTSTLRLVPTGKEAQELRSIALSFARRKGRARPLAQAGAVFLLYWMGATGDILETLYSREEAAGLPKEVARAWLACTVARSPGALIRLQALLLGHPSDDVARLARFLNDMTDGAMTTAPRLGGSRPRWPQPGKYFDARQWLMLELIANSPNAAMRRRVAQVLPTYEATALLGPEKRVLKRIKVLLSQPGAARQAGLAAKP